MAEEIKTTKRGFDDIYYFAYVPIFLRPKFPVTILFNGFELVELFPLPTLKNFRPPCPPYDIYFTIS